MKPTQQNAMKSKPQNMEARPSKKRRPPVPRPESGDNLLVAMIGALLAAVFGKQVPRQEN